MIGTHFTSRLAAAALLALSAGAHAEQAQAAEPQTAPAPTEQATPVGERGGEELFTQFCRACHAPGADHPGTMNLGFKKGPAQSVILNRSDLPPEYITQVVRNGLLEMPPLRPTDITDEELPRLVEYIRTIPADKAPPEPPGGAYAHPPTLEQIVQLVILPKLYSVILPAIAVALILLTVFLVRRRRKRHLRRVPI